MHKDRIYLKGFQGFWCRRCGGRVFEDEGYLDVHPETRVKKQMVELTCSLCARNYRCEYSNYIGLLRNIERILKRKKAAKNIKKPLLS